MPLPRAAACQSRSCFADWTGFAPDARSLDTTCVTVGRRTPSNSESVSCVTGRTLPLTRSWTCSNQLARRSVDRVQRIAGRDVLELSHQRPGVGLNRSLQGVAPVKRRLKSRRRNLQRSPCHPHHRGYRRARRPERRQDAQGSFIADDRRRDCLSVRHIHDEGDQAAKGEVDPFYRDRPTAPARRPVQASTSRK